MRDEPLLPTRRHLLLGAGALFVWSGVPRLARAADGGPRLLLIQLRGALDGLAAVAPVGDPQWSALRGEDGLSASSASPSLPLDKFFVLNPVMTNFHRMYQRSQALIVHACATPYRERSHFDGQEVLESGLLVPGKTESGWLNRTLGQIETAGRANSGKAFAVGPMTPLVVRGPEPVVVWTPPLTMATSDDTLNRLLDLYQQADPSLARFLDERSPVPKASVVGDDKEAMPPPKAIRGRDYFVEVGKNAARALARADGPRIGTLDLYGWDTHAKEGAIGGRLATLLGALDAALGAIEKESGPAWETMMVVVVTEFGRTVKINGTAGTDHGTGTVAFLAGGAVKGGRILADWPGLSQADLYEGRDLKPTTDLRSVLKGVLKEHLDVADNKLASVIFPDSQAVKPLLGLRR